MSRSGSYRLVQGTKELLIRLGVLQESYRLTLPGLKPLLGQIPRFQDDEGTLGWYDLEERLAEIPLEVLSTLPLIDRHPFLLPSAYPFTHFVGNTGEFSFSTSGGNGAQAQLITGSTEGYGWIRCGSTAGSRGSVSTALQNMRLGQSPDKPDLFRARGYVSRVMNSSDWAHIRLGFMSSLDGAIVQGVYFFYDAITSPNWRIGALNQNGNDAVTTSVPVVANQNYDFKIIIQNEGNLAKFFIDDVKVGEISNFIPKISGREVGVGATIVRVAGSTLTQFALDHIGGGVRQSITL